MLVETLIGQAKTGDQVAYALVVDALKRPLFGYLGRLGLAQSTAEDIAQESFLRAWQNLKRFDVAQASFATWLFTIARNLALNEMSRARYRHETSDEAAALAATSPTPSAPEQMIAAEARARLRMALGQLSPDDQRALALAYVDELTMAEAAAIECCTAGTFKTRLHRARTRLRHLLEDEHEN